jgi:hypothetical protein
LSEEAPP